MQKLLLLTAAAVMTAIQVVTGHEILCAKHAPTQGADLAAAYALYGTEMSEMTPLDVRAALILGLNKDGAELDEMAVTEARLVLIRQVFIDLETSEREAAGFDNLSPEE
jgi:hypothetical protein